MALSLTLFQMPRLFEVCKTGSSQQRDEIIARMTGPQKDMLSRILEISLDNLGEDQLGAGALKDIYSQQEQLKFLRMYAKCSKDSRNCLLGQRDQYLSQSGQGLSAVIRAALPVLVQALREVIENHPPDQAPKRKKKKKKSKTPPVAKSE